MTTAIRDAILTEAVQASIEYCGRADESFVLTYITELVAQDRRRREPRQPVLACGSWKVPDSVWMPKDAVWLYIPLPDKLSEWLNVEVGADGWTLIPDGKQRKLRVLTAAGSVEVADDPYWLMVRQPHLAPILASYNFAVSPKSHNKERNILFQIRSPLFESTANFLFAAPAAGADEYFKWRKERYEVREPAPRILQTKNFNMQEHLVAFQKELRKVYGDIAPQVKPSYSKIKKLDSSWLSAEARKN